MSKFPENDVIVFNYRSQNPWEAKGEFSDQWMIGHPFFEAINGKENAS